MKKFIASILVLIIVCAFSLPACGLFGSSSDVEEDIPPVVDGKSYNDKIKYEIYFIGEDEAPAGNINDANLHGSIDFETNKDYFMVLDFTISSFEASGWDKGFSAQVKISRPDAIQVRLEEVATSNFTESYDSDSSNITANYVIPEKRTKQRSYRMAVRFTILQQENFTIGTAFYGDNQSDYSFTEKNIIRKPTEGLNYYSYSEDSLTCSVMDKGTATDEVLYIPQYHEGKIVAEIMTGAFRDCTFLTDIIIADSIIKIGDSAFRDCTNITSVELPDSVVELGDSAFEGCDGIESVTLSEGLTTLGERVFCSCDKLPSIVIFDGVKEIGQQAFSSCISLSDIKLPNSISKLEWGTFADCVNLTKIVVPEGVKDLDQTFDGCINLTDVTLPESLVIIAPMAFRNCTALESIIIPSKVGMIGKNTFQGCENLKSVTLLNPLRWYALPDVGDRIVFSDSEMSDPSIVAAYLTDTYTSCSFQAESVRAVLSL